MATFAMSTTGCTTLDRWVLGEGTRADDEILVIGGGIAGLAAAYHLKKNRMSYRLCEASGRLGGRIQTLQHFNADQQFAEAGAEFFEESHREIAQLCQDVSLKTQDISYTPKADRAVYWLDGKIVNEKEFRKLLRPLALRLAQLRAEILSSVGTDLRTSSLHILPQAQSADRQSLGQIMGEFKRAVPASVLETFENICSAEWGVDVSEINLLQFLVRLTFEERSLGASPAKLFRVEGGNSRLIQVLGERVQGVLGSFALKLEYKLVEVKTRGKGYECTFITPKGYETIWARQVICTLPWSLLKEVKGLRNIGLPQPQITAIEECGYASHTKSVLSFKEPAWKRKSSGTAQGVFRGQLKGQSYWESSRGQPGAHGILSSQRGGKKAQGDLTDALTADALQDMRHFVKELGSPENAQSTDWRLKPFAKGSRLHCAPGSYLKYLEMLHSQTEKTGFYFAGEHMSFKDAGTMNGAVTTAIAAADLAMKKAHEKSAG